MKSDPRIDPKLTREALQTRFQAIEDEVLRLVLAAEDLDWLGDAAQQPPHSDQQKLAITRDDVDFLLSRLFMTVTGLARHRAETTLCQDLLLSVVNDQQSDGQEALHLMRRYHELFGDESDEDGETPPQTFPDCFAWDTYLRVSRLAKLVEQFPNHLRHSARQMHGWPMIVSHHLDCRHEFARVAELLELGMDYPLDVGPRKRRGKETPLLGYLEPLLWRVHVCRKVLREASGRSNSESETWRPDGNAFLSSLDPRPEPEEEVILARAARLPALTKESARVWSQKVMVPLVMLKDAGTAETCGIAALVNIWRHRSVKSRATFQSRLHSAVTDTLQRFGRPG